MRGCRETRSSVGSRSAGWSRVTRGVFAVGYRPAARESAWQAAVLALGMGAVLSYASAIALWAMGAGNGDHRGDGPDHRRAREARRDRRAPPAAAARARDRVPRDPGHDADPHAARLRRGRSTQCAVQSLRAGPGPPPHPAGADRGGGDRTAPGAWQREAPEGAGGRGRSQGRPLGARDPVPPHVRRARHPAPEGQCPHGGVDAGLLLARVGADRRDRQRRVPQHRMGAAARRAEGRRVCAPSASMCCG